MIADWTSFEDVGKSFNGEVLTAAEYRRVEDSYISAVAYLADAMQADRFELRNLVLNEPPPAWLGAVYDGCSVDRHTALRLLRWMLRHGLLSCTLTSGDTLRVAVETDFYLSVEIQPDAVDSLDEVKRLGLHVVSVPCGKEESDAASRPADGEFWEEVAQSVRLSRGTTAILERWADGSYGCRWHPILDEDLSIISRSIRPHSLVTAYLDANVQWISRQNLLPAIESATMAEELPVVIFSRSIGGVSPEILVCREGVDLPTEAEVPLGDDFGFFLWPDDDSTSIQAVVPGD
ncbi:hypothetical protein B7C62_20715 [Kitasatospora albolonga]|uniref:Uncharacterized protein n=1 Tax=Kitasatospora albolonga TaxID=68173 RepID=A0ABC8BVD6_9ACTN|nr:hypothetical protein B7C62_20715 [Kitasatospora albolonga]